MTFSGVLIANRGEIAIRIGGRAGFGFAHRGCVFPTMRQATYRWPTSQCSWKDLVRALISISTLLSRLPWPAADAIHPGYGFLSEQTDFAAACAQAGIKFIGPSPEHLSLFGDKARAREAAIAADVPVLQGIDRAVTLEEARIFAQHPSGIIVKALAGGIAALVQSPRKRNYLKRLRAVSLSNRIWY